MKADYWRKGVATLMTAGLLAAGAVAQDGAEGEVNITETAPAATSTEPAAKAPAKPIKPQIVDRDPFVNLLLTGNVSAGTARSRPARSIKRSTPAAAAANNKAGAAAGSVAAEQPPEPEIPAPEVTVNGIVSSGSGRQAIISTGVGTRMISTGQKLGDYRVATIGPDYVTFSYGGTKNFKVPIENEFAPK